MVHESLGVAELGVFEPWPVLLWFWLDLGSVGGRVRRSDGVLSEGITACREVHHCSIRFVLMYVV
jgi:hypothetical protein